MKYYCFEIATEGSYHLWVDADEKKMNKELSRQLEELGDEVDTYAVGTCEAASIEHAQDCIRSGNWEYCQKV